MAAKQGVGVHRAGRGRRIPALCGVAAGALAALALLGWSLRIHVAMGLVPGLIVMQP